MEIYIWAMGAVLVGGILGVIGYYFSKLAYSAFMIALTAIAYFSDAFFGQTGMAAGSDAFNIGGLFRKATRAVDAMGLLPEHMQLSIVVFIASFFIARIGVWWFKTFKESKAAETVDAKRARILHTYGLNSMDELRERY